MEILGYIAAVLMGLSLGIVGGGGAILTVPILVYFFKQDALLATTGSMFVVGMTAFVGAAINAKKGFIDYKMGITFAVPSFAGVLFARQIALPWIPESMILPGGLILTKSLLVLISFSILMIFASRAMIKSGVAIGASQRSHSIRSIGLKGFLVGCTTGFVGAGGGFLIIPALVLLLHVPMRTAVGTSLAIISANSLFGFAISFGGPAIDWSALLPVTLLGSIGLAAGHHLSHRFHENRLKVGFGYFVLVMGVVILLDQLRIMA